MAERAVRKIQGEDLGLRAGDWVEVRSEEEILDTLEPDGSLEGQVFMPEMLQHCGHRFQVQSRADKTCDTITKTGSRRMLRTVHLDTRCDGSAHGQCQASCLFYWKEAWLRRVDGPGPASAAPSRPERRSPPRCTREGLYAATRKAGNAVTEGGEPIYRCQVTDILRATSPMAWWDLRQYWRDLRSGNVTLRRFFRVVAIATFNVIQRRRGGSQYPKLGVPTLAKTPNERLDLQPGELVQIKRPDEIVATLDVNYKNRGMRFDERMMTHYCGTTQRVLKRVDRIIDEQTGKMIKLPNECIILDGVICNGDLTRLRLFCPRSTYPYWREIWLRRIEESVSAGKTT